MLDYQTLLNIWLELYKGLIEFWNVLSTPLIDILYGLPPPFNTFGIVTGIINALGGSEFVNTPLIVLIIGGGVFIFVGITFVKWLIGIIT